MKIRKVVANNRRKAFEVQLHNRTLYYPYAQADPSPQQADRVADAYVDPEIDNEGFTYELSSGSEGTVHVDQVLEYNEDPTYLGEALLYNLTVEAQKHLEQCPLSKREIIRRLGTSATQFYRLIDQANYKKSLGQLVALLHILGCDVDLVVKKRA